MLQERFGRECKVCGRPYTVFKWSPGVGERWKKTEICQTCAKIKNSCQTCILDLEYGIHTKDRDDVLNTHNAIPMSDVNTQMYIRNMEAKMGDSTVVNHGKAESAAKEVLKKLAKSAADPYTRRNRSNVCAFYLKGNCKRDKACPFLHEVSDAVLLKHKLKGQTTTTKPIPTTTDDTNQQQTSQNASIALVPPPPPGDSKDRYPSQNPSMLGTTTRTYRA
ncbi:hypothetical protein BC833DRAFT_603908 [Globomyces pollinis-pini]|nr:hypothetical protein BC833DRAFT_603908 [Globomyces pollinis-pini]